MLYAQFLQQAGQALLDLVTRKRLAALVVLQLQHGAHIVFNIEFAKNRGFLRQITQAQARAPVHRHVGDRLTIDRDVAGAGVHQADDHVKRCGLAGAIGAKQTDHLALADRKRHVLDGLATAIELLQVMDFEAALATSAIGPGDGFSNRLWQCHFFSPPSVLEERKGSAAEALAAGASAAGLGVSMARTRLAGAAEPGLTGAPSMLNTSLLLL